MRYRVNASEEYISMGLCTYVLHILLLLLTSRINLLPIVFGDDIYIIKTGPILLYYIVRVLIIIKKKKKIIIVLIDCVREYYNGYGGLKAKFSFILSHLRNRYEKLNYYYFSFKIYINVRYYR